MPIYIDLHNSGFKRFEGALATINDGAKVVMVRTINRVLPSARTLAAREAREELALPARNVTSSFKIKRATRDAPTGVLRSRGKGLPLYWYQGRPNRPGTRPPVGASAVPKRSEGRKVYPGSFVARMPNRHVGIWERLTRRRFPIKHLTGPAIPDVLNQEPSRSRIEEGTRERLEREFRHQASYLISRAASK